jgi:hypothetical protein
MRIVLRILHGLMAGLFIFAAALQYNDEDIVRWMVIYLAAAVPSVFAAAGRPLPRFAAITGGVAVAWMILYLAHGAGYVSLPALFSEWEMKDETVKAGREMYGLLIVAAWMAVCWATGRPARKPAGTA